MYSQTEILQLLKSFGVAGCHVRASDYMCFSCQRWEEDDVLVPRETIFFTYDLARPKSQPWGFREWDPCTSIFGSSCFKPEEKWVFINSQGNVYSTGGGEDDDESSILSAGNKYFSVLKCIDNGYVYAVGPGRKVVKRQRKNKWISIDSPSMKPKKKEFEDSGFSAIDGFSDTDLYASGGAGDLWHFDGQRWTFINLGTNVVLENICCSSDGNVYIITNANVLIVGRNDRWEILDQEIGEEILEEMVCYKGTVYISSHKKLYEIKKKKIVDTKLKLPKMDSYSHLAEGDGILLLAGIHCAYFYDGKKWHKVFDFC